jgi:catechol 2,3-dioxygenase-like lactoylglutathione lyase family enzyme
MLAKIDFAFVAKVNVSNLDRSVRWYEENLDMKEDGSFATDTWRQLNLPGLRRVAFGLNLSSDTGTSTAVATIVVDDIESAREALVAKGVEVGPIQQFGNVQMCYFRDPDSNRLGFRQNAPDQPRVAEIGA